MKTSNSNVSQSGSDYPEISVIIPAYNAEKTILSTINSVLNQTFSDFELIIINDGSTDSTLNVANSVEDSRIKVLNYENGGVSEARNRGVKLSRGSLITFLDADDLWTADKLELQLKALKENPKAGIAYSWTFFMDEDGKSHHTIDPIFFEGNVLHNLLISNFIASGSNPLIRKEAIDSVGFFDRSISGAAEDWDYWIRLATKWTYAVVPKEQIFYRQSRRSMSSNIEYNEECQLRVVKNFFESAPQDLASLKKRSLSNIYRHSSKLYLDKFTEKKELRSSVLKLVKAVHLFPKTLLELRTLKFALKLSLSIILPPKISIAIFNSLSKARNKNID